MRYELDELTAENGSVLGNLLDNTEPASLHLSTDLADELRLRIKQVHASLVEGQRDIDPRTPRRVHVPTRALIQ